MKPATTLKELLKPPFLLKDHYIYDSGKEYMAQISLTSFGWTKKLREELQQFVVQALNEKWERDFGKPLR